MRTSVIVRRFILLFFLERLRFFSPSRPYFPIRKPAFSGAPVRRQIERGFDFDGFPNL